MHRYASSGSQISGNQNGPGDKILYDLTNNLKRVTDKSAVQERRVIGIGNWGQ